MSKSILSPGSEFGDYQIIEQLGTDSAIARHTTSGRELAVRILGRGAPSDASVRDELISRLRLSASLDHPAFPAVRDLDVADGAVYLAHDLVRGRKMDEVLSSGPATVSDSIRWGWQLAGALASLHSRGLVHGALDGTSVLVDEAGNLRIVGLTAAALNGRRDRGDLDVLRREISPSQLAHRSPEAVSGHPLDSRSDIFSCGVLLYRMVTGVSPFDADEHDEVATRLTRSNPRNPREIVPEIPAPLLAAIGRCLFKKPDSRYPDGAALQSELEQLEPGVSARAAYPRADRGAAAAAPESRTEVTTLFVADIPFWNLLERSDPDKAQRIAARMQQMLGESIYLSDGEVIDSLGSLMVALIPDASGAVTAAYRSLDELSLAAAAGEAIEPRILLVRGEIERRGAEVFGPVVEHAFRTLSDLAPGQLLVGERVFSNAGVDPGGPAVGESGGESLYVLPLRRDEEELNADETVAISDPSLTSHVLGDETVAVAPQGAPARRASSGKLLVVVLALLILVAALVAAFLWMRPREARANPVRSQTPAAASAKALVAVPLPSEEEYSAESLPVARGSAAALKRLLGGRSDVTLIDESRGDATHLTFEEVGGAEGGVTLRPRIRNGEAGPVVTLEDEDAAVREVITWTAGVLGLPAAGIVPPQGAAASFAAASLAALEGRMEVAAAAAERSTSAGPEWLPAWELAMEAHEAAGNRDQALAAAAQVARLDPADLGVREKLALAAVESGSPVSAIPHVSTILARRPDHPRALEIVGRYSLAAADGPRFDRVVSRLEKRSDSATMRTLHRGDVHAVAGDLDQAIARYFETEEKEPRNAALVFKIGRAAALRNSFETAQLELDKLRELDPDVGARVLEAYILAQRDEPARVPQLLELAQRNARWNDDVWTWSAEIWAKLGERQRVTQALERALARGEANYAFVLRQKPFFYLGYDARGQKLVDTMERRRRELKSALETTGV